MSGDSPGVNDRPRLQVRGVLRMKPAVKTTLSQLPVGALHSERGRRIQTLIINKKEQLLHLHCRNTIFPNLAICSVRGIDYRVCSEFGGCLLFLGLWVEKLVFGLKSNAFVDWLGIRFKIYAFYIYK